MNDVDAQALLYALDPLLRAVLASASGRQVFLRTLAPTDMPIDTDRQDLLEAVDFLSGQ